MRRFPGHRNPPPPPPPPVIHKTIKAKALRKKGTDLLYKKMQFGKVEPEFWVLPGNIPSCFNPILSLSDLKDYKNLPKDAELIDITIIIEE